jgi:hypothetical protein
MRILAVGGETRTAQRRKVRGHLQIPAAAHEVLGVVALVGAHRPPAAALPLAVQHLEPRLSLGPAIGRGDLHIHHQAAPCASQTMVTTLIPSPNDETARPASRRRARESRSKLR